MGEVTHAPSVGTAGGESGMPDRRTETAQALAAMSQAWRSIEAARGHLHEFHHLAGEGDAHLVRAVGLLRAGGHHDLADAICHHLVGHGAEDRWSFQVAEEHDDDFFRTLMTLEEQVRDRSTR